MTKYKVCPNCLEKNSPTSISCSNCDMDLTNVKVTDSDLEATQLKKPENSEPFSEVTLVKICDCGAVNPAQARKCQECGEDISDIQPSIQQPREQESQEELHFSLSAVDDDTFYIIPCSGLTIGRESGLKESLISKKYVSRIHAKLIVENNDLFIENLSTTNYTFVNNVRIPQGKYKLSVGDEIGLGGICVNGTRQSDAAYFVVGIA